MPQASENLAGFLPRVESWHTSAEAEKTHERACILCRGPLEGCVSGLFDSRFGVEGSYEVRRCVRCGLEQLFPVPTVAQLKSLYEAHYNFGGERGTLYTNLR